jgi:hypothetical protein
MALTDLQHLRAARSQLLFREVNARLVDLNEAFESLAETGVFVCECASMDCIEQMELPLGEYRRIRADARRFILAPSCSRAAGAGRVVEEREGYVVLELTGTAARIAEGAIDVSCEQLQRVG